ncbi:hypothetical protein HK105_207013 [Polyrhizophydium stewartii]|uniref:SYO1-like TPR repeats domain-containing protein n=1 Tax=Polyrhizophydium stewartii TaxID=2732419 RepID=A0ABR4N1Z0_9FUNG
MPNEAADAPAAAAAASISAAAAVPSLPISMDLPQSVKTLPVLNKLQSSDVSERSWAATTISHFVQDAAVRKQLVDGGLVPRLVALLQDPHGRVVLDVLGALQNVVIFGGERLSQDMIEDGVAEPLIVCFGKIATLVRDGFEKGQAEEMAASAAAAAEAVAAAAADPEAAAKKAADEASGEDPSEPSPFELAEQVIGLLWSLGEISNDVVRLLSTPDIMAFVMSMLNPAHASVVPWALSRVCAQFLSMLCDHNPAVHRIFAQNPAYAECLVSYVKGSTPGFASWNDNKISLPILCASILECLRPALIDASDAARMGEFYEAIAVMASHALDFDIASHMPRLEACASAVDAHTAKINSDPLNSNVESAADLHTVETKEMLFIRRFEGQLETLQVLLEMLANIFSEELADSDESDSASDNEDDEMDEDMDAEVDALAQEASGASNAASTDTHLSVLSAALFSERTALFAKIGRIATLRIAHVGCKAAEQATRHIRAAQTRALGCIGNMVLVGYLDAWIAANPAALAELWQALFEICAAASTQPVVDMELVEALVSLQWSIVNKVEGQAPLVPLKAEYVQWFLTAVAPTSGAPASLRAKGVGILAYFARIQGNIETNRTIGRAFLAQLASSDSPQVLSEILNGIFDVYGDAAFDYDLPVFVQGGFLAQLQKLFPVLRTQFRAIDKRKMREVRERADEMLLNLHAFIKYKSRERK